jgi:YesN/AraC family two-component response regulator
MSAPGQAAGGDAGGEAQGGEAQGIDYAKVSEQLAQQNSTMQEMHQFLASNPWQPQEAEAEQPEADNLDLSWLDPQNQVYDDPNAVAQRLNDQISGAVEQRVQALTDPMREQMAEMRRDQQARDLAAEFPEIATDEMAQQIAGPGGLAAQMAESLGQPGLAAEPSFWRLVYMAHKQAEQANENGSDGPGVAALESSGGPGPAQQSNEDIVKGIMDAGGQGSKVLNFRQ